MEFLEFGQPPETVQANVAEMTSIMEQRKRGNDATKLKHDTERYLILVFPDRASKEAVLASIGLPPDERYLYGPAIALQLRQAVEPQDAQIVAADGRPCHAADSGHSGAGG